MLLIFLFLILLNINYPLIAEEIEAYTYDGQKVTLFEDGTWAFTGEKLASPSKEGYYEIPNNVDGAIESPTGLFGVVYSKELWKGVEGKDLGEAHMGFFYKNGSGYGLIRFTEQRLTMKGLIRQALSSPDLAFSKIIDNTEEVRIVNGVPVTFLKTTVEKENGQFVWLAYLTLAKQGSFEFSVFVPVAEFKAHPEHYFNLLNGVIFSAGENPSVDSGEKLKTNILWTPVIIQDNIRKKEPSEQPVQEED